MLMCYRERLNDLLSFQALWQGLSIWLASQANRHRSLLSPRGTLEQISTSRTSRWHVASRLWPRPNSQWPWTCSPTQEPPFKAKLNQLLGERVNSAPIALHEDYWIWNRAGMLERSALRGLLMLMLLTVRTGTELRRSTSVADANTAAG
ncbi:uncharacterized [Tachysurus ichikawai]